MIGNLRQLRLEPIDQAVIERRDVAVLARRQTLEPGLARVHDQFIGAGRNHRLRQRAQRHFRILIVDADAALDRHGNAHRALHCRNALGNQRGLRHQAGAEAALLDAIRRAADIEIDLVVTKVLADTSAGGELRPARSRQAAALPDARLR